MESSQQSLRFVVRAMNKLEKWINVCNANRNETTFTESGCNRCNRVRSIEYTTLCKDHLNFFNTTTVRYSNTLSINHCYR